MVCADDDRTFAPHASYPRRNVNEECCVKIPDELYIKRSTVEVAGLHRIDERTQRLCYQIAYFGIIFGAVGSLEARLR